MFLRMIIAVLIFGTISSYSLDDKEKAIVIAKKAVELMNKGEYQESIDSLNVCLDLDSSNINYKYEKALAFTRLKRYQKAIDILSPILSEQGSNDKFFQLLGSCYESLSARKAAYQVYKDGLEKFPNSGRLYQELGSNKLGDTNLREAIEYWKQGILVNPEYANNYYLIVMSTLAKDSLITLGSLFIAEEYLNISNSPKRSKEITQLLHNTYKSIFVFSSEDYEKYKKSSEFFMATERDFVNSLAGIIRNDFYGKRSNNKSFSNDFNICRDSLVNDCRNNNLNKKYNKKIFEYFNLMQQNSTFEAYNMLMFNSQYPKEVNTWREKNIEKVNAYSDWLNKNIYTVFIKE